MRILYLATSFPEEGLGATIYTDLAEALLEAGHEITVVASEQRRNVKRTEMRKERGLDVLRVATGNYYDVGFIEKGISTLVYPYMMKSAISRHMGGKAYDMILFESPPVTNCSLVEWAKRRFGCRSYLMMKDIFPQNAVDLGIIKEGSLVHRYFRRLEKRLYLTADAIGCMSQANIEYLRRHNGWLDAGKIELFPNTKKIGELMPTGGFRIRKKLGIPDGAKLFLFGGNMGKPQYVDLLCEICSEFSGRADTFFLAVGRGTDRGKLAERIKVEGIKNALILENLPRDEFEQIVKEADVGLIILDPRFTIPNFPSRILSYMEHAKPVAAFTDRVSDIKDLVEGSGCGVWAWSGDKTGVFAKIDEMAASDKLEEMGLKGRKYTEENFRVERSVRILERRAGTLCMGPQQELADGR